MQVVADGVGCEETPSAPWRENADFYHRFIIDGIITIPIALYGFAMFPDVPTTTKAFYLSEEVRV